MARSLIALLFLPVFVLFAQHPATRWKGPDQPVYVVTRNHYAGVFAPDVNGTLLLGELIMIEIFHPSGLRIPEVPYQVGASYTLFAGGEQIGKVRVKKIAPLQCNSSAAIVAADTSIRFSDATMALATNSKNIRTHSNPQRDPSPEERLNAIRLAMMEFRKHGVPQALASELKLERLVVTQIDGDSQKILSGSLTIKTNKAQHRVFLIAGTVGNNAATELAIYNQSTDLEDGKDSQTFRFVDQLDLDGDGIDELVVETIGYESEGFTVYRRQAGTWKQVWAGGGGAC
jgi:hypothetical protein